MSVLNEKAGPPVIAPQPTNYGNLPLEVSQSGSPAPGPDGKKPSKFEEQGKKFGKKMGNAGTFLLWMAFPFEFGSTDKLSSYIWCWCYNWLKHC